MLRAIATQMQSEIAVRFGYSTPLDEFGAPRDVLWTRQEVAIRKRQEQSSRLARPISDNMPFMSFYRIATSIDRSRINLPATKRGAAFSTSVDGKTTRTYSMRPVLMVFQIEHWADKPNHWETAIENWVRWAAPPITLTLTDLNGTQISVPLEFSDSIDNSQLEQEYDIGRVYRVTFTTTARGWVMNEPNDSPFKTILTERINIWTPILDVGTPALVKQVTET